MGVQRKIRQTGREGDQREEGKGGKAEAKRDTQGRRSARRSGRRGVGLELEHGEVNLAPLFGIVLVRRTTTISSSINGLHTLHTN